MYSELIPWRVQVPAVLPWSWGSIQWAIQPRPAGEFFWKA